MNKKDALSLAKRKAMKLAEFRLSNEREKNDCVNDLTSMGLSQNEARVIAASYQAQVLPAVAKHEGLDEEDFKKLVRLCGLNEMTANFAKDTDDLSDDTEENDGEEGDELDELDDMADEKEDSEKEKLDHELDPIEDEDSELDSFKDESAIDNADSDESGDFGHFDDAEDAMMGESHHFGNGLGEDFNVGGKDTAVVEVEVPKEQLDAFMAFLENFKNEQEEYSNSDVLEEKKIMEDSGDTEPSLSEEDHAEDNAEISEHALPLDAATRKVQYAMNKTQLAQRRAAREAIMTKTASEENKPRDVKHGDDTTSGTYMGEKASAISKSKDAQYSSEKKYPTMTLEGSEGNSLKEQNPTFNKLKIPTRNPDNLGLKDSYEVLRNDGDSAGDDTLSYEVDLDKLDWVPSTNPDREELFAIPTQMEQRSRNTTSTGGRIASIAGYTETEITEAEDALFNALKTAGLSEQKISKMSMAEAISTLGQMRFASTPDVAIEVNAEEAETPKENMGMVHGDDFKSTPHKTDESRASRSSEASNAVYQARLKTAWAITAKLCSAGLISNEDMESNVDTWMNDNLSVKNMISTGTQFLKMATTAKDRVLEASANRSGQRTASVATNTIITPSNNVAKSNVGSQSDWAQALSSVLHNDEFEKYDAYVRDRSDRRH